MEVELRTYSKNGNCLNSKYISGTLEDLQKIFPNVDFKNIDEDIWIKTEEQANYFGVDYNDLIYIDYNILF